MAKIVRHKLSAFLEKGDLFKGYLSEARSRLGYFRSARFTSTKTAWLSNELRTFDSRLLFRFDVRRGRRLLSGRQTQQLHRHALNGLVTMPCSGRHLQSESRKAGHMGDRLAALKENPK